MKTIRDIDIKGKSIVLRADYNVPLDNGVITDDFRITQALPTLQYLLEQDCRVVIISHLGRPEGMRDMQYSLAPVVARLNELLGQEVILAEDFDDVDSDKNPLTLLENLRFWPEETENDEDFGKRLAGLGEIFVQDGFGVVHRAHASTDAVTRFVPSVAGLLLAREVDIIERVMHNPDHPLVAIFGGAKISDKIKVIEKFMDRAEHVLIGGAMANTFFAFDGHNIGKSKFEAGQEDVISALLNQAKSREGEEHEARKVTDQHTIVIPKDVKVAEKVSADVPSRVVAIDEVSDEDIILDIGPESIDAYKDILANAKTVVWNGPLGLTELPQFADGSNHIAQILKERHSDITSVIGGGDTAGFVLQWDDDAESHFSHISTGGGAALELMSGKELPGVAALMQG